MDNTTNAEPQWSFAADDDKLFGIETLRYPNGQVMRKCTLSDGRIAIARRLKGSDAKDIRRLVGADENRYQVAMAARCLKINDAEVTMEDLDDLWMDDHTKVMMLATVNFPLTPNA